MNKVISQFEHIRQLLTAQNLASEDRRISGRYFAPPVFSSGVKQRQETRLLSKATENLVSVVPQVNIR